MKPFRAVALVLWLIPATATAGTIVADGVHCTVAEAIVAANTDVDAAGCAGTSGVGHADTIQLAANESITLAEAQAAGSSLQWQVRAALPDVVSEITIEATGTGRVIERAAAGCGPEQADGFRLFHVHESGAQVGHLTLVGLTLRNGCAVAPPGWAGGGGAVYVASDASSLHLSDCRFEANVGRSGLQVVGGAIWSLGPVSATDTDFVGNSAFGGAAGLNAGGAVAVDAPVVVLRGSFTDNLLVGADGTLAADVAGGALATTTDTNIRGTLFERNGAKAGATTTGRGGAAHGGAIHAGAGSTSLLEVVLRENVAEAGSAASGPGGEAGGGAVYSDADVDLSFSVVEGNQALGGPSATAAGGSARGGGVAATFPGAWIHGSAFLDNEAVAGSSNGGTVTADARGGGLFLGGRVAEVEDTTLAHNRARGGANSGATAGGTGHGGGALILAEAAKLVNVTAVDNEARGGEATTGPGGEAFGGGLLLANMPTLAFLTVTGNRALGGSGAGHGRGSGGGIYGYGLAVEHSILFGNTESGGDLPGSDCYDAQDLAQGNHHNLVGVAGTCSFPSGAGNQIGVADAKLASLGNRGCGQRLPDGSCLPVVGLRPGSSAIDAGACSPTLDAVGRGRPAGVACDIGALESMLGSFHTVTPCRVLDTRSGLPYPSGASVVVPVTGRCDVPAGVTAVALNVTVVSPSSFGHVSVYPGDRLTAPTTSTVNFPAFGVRANSAVVALSSDGAGQLRVLPVLAGGGATHLLIDVTGWFE